MPGAGVALPFSERLTPLQRRLVGLVFPPVGVLTTIPAARMVLARPDEIAADRSAPEISNGTDNLSASIRGDHYDRTRIPIPRMPTSGIPITMVPIAVMPVTIVMIVAPMRLSVLAQRQQDSGNCD